MKTLCISFLVFFSFAVAAQNTFESTDPLAVNDPCPTVQNTAGAPAGFNCGKPAKSASDDSQKRRMKLMKQLKIQEPETATYIETQE